MNMTDVDSEVVDSEVVDSEVGTLSCLMTWFLYCFFRLALCTMPSIAFRSSMVVSDVDRGKKKAAISVV
jgi:hypothetical protein